MYISQLVSFITYSLVSFITYSLCICFSTVPAFLSFLSSQKNKEYISKEPVVMLNASNLDYWANERVLAMVRDPLAPTVLHPQRQYSRVDAPCAVHDLSDVAPARSAAALKELKRKHMIHINTQTERERQAVTELPDTASKAVSVYCRRGCKLTPQL